MATRIDIARAVAEKEQISIKDANSIIASTIEAISETAKKEELHLLGLGTFRLVDVPARQGRNPKTGEAISIPAKTVVRFKPSKSLNPTPPAKAATKSRGKNQGRRTAGKRKRSR